jgi:peptide/nickel transport system permease protein
MEAQKTLVPASLSAADRPWAGVSIWRRNLRQFARNRLALVGAILFLIFLIAALAAPVVAPYSYDKGNFTEIWKPPSIQHWLGTDKVGRDVLSRLIYGVRTSLFISFTAQIIVLVIGVLLGTTAGLSSSAVDQVIMRAVDVVASFPTLLFTILLMALLGGGIPNLILALSISSWANICTLTRAQVLSLREREYILASRSFGASRIGITFRHLIPNILPSLIVSSTLGIPSYIVAEAGLGYLGLGIMPPTPSLGQLLQDAAQYLLPQPMYMLYTAVTLAILTISIAFIGDGLRDVLDPQSWR